MHLPLLRLEPTAIEEGALGRWEIAKLVFIDPVVGEEWTAVERFRACIKASCSVMPATVSWGALSCRLGVLLGISPTRGDAAADARWKAWWSWAPWLFSKMAYTCIQNAQPALWYWCIVPQDCCQCVKMFVIVLKHIWYRGTHTWLEKCIPHGPCSLSFNSSPPLIIPAYAWETMIGFNVSIHLFKLICISTD